MLNERTACDPAAGDRREWIPVALGAAMVAMLVLLYGVQGNAEEVGLHGRSAIVWMVRRWSGVGGDLSHGWIIPLVSGYILWRKRRELAEAPRRVSGAGLAIVVASLALHWVGVRSQLTRLSLLSLVGLLWGIPFYLWGPSVARLLLFPCAYLIYCIPLSFLNNVTLPLRLFASSASAALLNGIGIEAVRSGTAIRSMAAGGFNFDVADPCSGLRSLLAMTALTAVYAYLTQRTLLKKWVLFLAAAPLAMAGNVVRIVAIAVVAETLGHTWALRVYHDYSGFLVFAVAIVLMVALGRALNTDYRSRWRQWKTASTNTRSSSSP
jgi:exosortase